MDPDIASLSATLAALLGAPLLAFTGADATLVVVLVGLGFVVGLALGAGATRYVQYRRRTEEPPELKRRRPIRPSRAGLAEDPIVVALGVKDDESGRARRRRRPIGTGLHAPPGDSPPPT